MAKYVVTHGKTTVAGGGNPYPVGMVLDLEVVPTSLVGKVRQLEGSADFEVATPDFEVADTPRKKR